MPLSARRRRRRRRLQCLVLAADIAIIHIYRSRLPPLSLHSTSSTARPRPPARLAAWRTSSTASVPLSLRRVACGHPLMQYIGRVPRWDGYGLWTDSLTWRQIDHRSSFPLSLLLSLSFSHAHLFLEHEICSEQYMHRCIMADRIESSLLLHLVSIQ